MTIDNLESILPITDQNVRKQNETPRRRKGQRNGVNSKWVKRAIARESNEPEIKSRL